MKRKGQRDIPDFSSKRTPAAKGEGHGAPTPDAGAKRPPVVRQPNVKPQATSAKGGRRGS